MAYKCILVHIDGRPDSARRIEAAAALATEFGARLTGIAVVPPLHLPQRLRSHPGAKAILKEEFEKSLASARGFARDFEKKAKAAGIPAESIVAEDEPVRALTRATHCVDLVVVGKPGEDDVGALGGHFVEEAVLESSRPVLVVPPVGEAQAVGRRVLVAWKDARDSARALADALPFLERAGRITVLTVDEEGTGPASGADAIAYLERHGLKGEVVSVKDEDAGHAILSQARKLKADLVVMGAYARPRIAELVLGGATRTVLQKMTMPVLMSH